MIHSYPWYPADWRGSQEVISLTAEQRDVYRNLLDACWVDGSLPNNCTVLHRLSMADASEWARSWPKVRKLFRLKNRRLHHPKVDEKRPHLIDWHEQKSKAGKRSVESRRAKRERTFNGRSTDVPTDVQQAFKPSSTSTYIGERVVHTTEHSGAPENPPRAQTTAGFDAFWSLYLTTGKPTNEHDHLEAAREWVIRECDDVSSDVLAALREYIDSCRDLIRNQDTRMLKAAHRWLREKPWTRRGAVVADPDHEVVTVPDCAICNSFGWVYVNPQDKNIGMTRCECRRVARAS